MKCCSACFDKTLFYESPAHGGWGVIRTAALVPELYMLFVAPFACGRHGALGALLNGIKNKVSYLYLEEKDIVSGDYEAKIPQALDELFEFLPKRPRVVMIFVSCLDDMLGTDHEALNEKLSKKYPDVIFRTGHMNPIQTDTTVPPLVGLMNTMYSLLAEGIQSQKRISDLQQVSFIGNNCPIDKNSEVYRLFSENGIRIRQIKECSDFDDFCNFRNSCLNVVVNPVAKYAATNMQKVLGIPFLLSYVTYNPDEIRTAYKQLQDTLCTLGKTVTFDVEADYERAVALLRQTAELLDGKPVAIDFQASKKSITLTKTLLEYGFTVRLLAIDGVPSFEKESFAWLQEHYPQLEVVSPVHHDSPKFEYYSYSDCLCIGFNSGYMTNSTHVVSIMDDEANYGFGGVIRLMDMVQTAYYHSVDVAELIKEAKIVV
ncbi:MAG: nitrogenase component 1 [Treponema sp.]|nr:nitrogenase component 1 [Treponema sp.]